MNAYELADKLKVFWHTENDNLFEESATMLRQQADRIAELEKVIQDGIKTMCEIQDQRAKEKFLSSKPVAWMLVTGHGTKILEKKPYCEVDYWKPLYTHPVKQLSNEEIERIAEKYLTANAQFIGAGEVTYDGEIEFARAIIKEITE